MATFGDTSAILPLVYEEIHTPLAKTAAGGNGLHLAWEWLRVEARLATARRGDQPDRLARLNEWVDGGNGSRSVTKN